MPTSPKRLKWSYRPPATNSRFLTGVSETCAKTGLVLGEILHVLRLRTESLRDERAVLVAQDVLVENAGRQRQPAGESDVVLVIELVAVELRARRAGERSSSLGLLTCRSLSYSRTRRWCHHFVSCQSMLGA